MRPPKQSDEMVTKLCYLAGMLVLSISKTADEFQREGKEVPDVRLFLDGIFLSIGYLLATEDKEYTYQQLIERGDEYFIEWATDTAMDLVIRIARDQMDTKSSN